MDEAHHITSPQYLSVKLEHFGLRRRGKGSPVLVGVSATFLSERWRQLGRRIRLSGVPQGLPRHDRSRGGSRTSCSPPVRLVKTDLGKVGVLGSGDFASGELSRAVNTPEQRRSGFCVAGKMQRAQVHPGVLRRRSARPRSGTHFSRDAATNPKFVTGSTPESRTIRNDRSVQEGGIPGASELRRFRRRDGHGKHRLA